MREAAGAEAGDVVTLEIASVGDEPEPRVPADLRKALATAATLVKAAHESIRQASLTELSVRDRDVFLETLDSNAAPNAALKKAAKRYRSQRG